MKVVIDTTRDSKEDIRKVISFLQSFVNNAPEAQKSVFDNPGPSVDVPGFALFDAPAKDSPVKKPVSEKRTRIEVF